MAALVQFLASGVNGAANGTATFVLRGTASSAASVLWSDFEQTSQPGTNIITLDANGAAEVYTTAYCDVTLKTSAGSALRTVTFGNSATTTEVVSDSFTGTDYSGSPTAVSEPITLAAVLDKWNNSAGSTGIDWKVDINGVGTNLSTAFAALAGLFFNVKDPAYGAVGDGVTDDTTAIGLAITAAAAAGGGIVFFPASTTSYKFTTLSISAANITLMGVGPSASVLSSASTSALISFTNNTSTGWKRIIGLGITGTGASANAVLVLEETQRVYLENVVVTNTSFTGNTITRSSDAGRSTIIMRDCEFLPGSGVDSVLCNLSVTGNTSWIVSGCKFKIPASFVGSVILGCDFYVSQCIFDGSAVTSGIYRHVNAVDSGVTGKYIGSFIGNSFIDGGSTGFAFQLTDIASACDFLEDNNTFSGFTAPTAVTSAGQIYNVSHGTADAHRISLGSRKGRILEVSNSSTGTITPSAITAYEHIYLTHTGAGNITLDMPLSTMVAGNDATIIILNSSGSNRDMTVNCGATPVTFGTTLGADTDGVGLATNDVAPTGGIDDGDSFFLTFKYTHSGSGAPMALLIGAAAS
jgi:hypothetical protein